MSDGTLESTVVWEGDVHVFDLENHATPTRCYAWPTMIDESAPREIVVMLHDRMAHSPQMAVRVAIAKGARATQTP